MNKVILMSIQSKWLVKILNGEKTIEIRKTIPDCKLPIDVYLYCTKEKPYLYENWDGCCYKLTRAKTWQERANEEDYTSVEMFHLEEFGGELNGKVVAKFTLNNVDEYEHLDSGYDLSKFVCSKTNDMVFDDYRPTQFALKSCLEYEDIVTYAWNKKYGGLSKINNIYAWHIENLVVLDKPKELSEFMITNIKEGWTYYFNACEGFTPLPKETYIGLINRGRAPVYCYKTLSKAPQSWQYAYVNEK